MKRQTFPNRSQLVALSLIGLLGLVFLLAVEKPELSGVARSEGESEAAVDVRIARVDPADRKFYLQDGRRSSLDIGIHPADIKFLGWTYARGWSPVEAQAVVERAHPADRKFYMAYGGADSLETTIHPADIKFFGGSYTKGVPPAAIQAESENIHPADRKFYFNWQ